MPHMRFCQRTFCQKPALKLPPPSPRGIDFKGVRTVVNVHPPPSVAAYVHRAGRTGRAGQAGTALSLLSPGDVGLRAQLEEALSGARALHRSCVALLCCALLLLIEDQSAP